MRLAIVVPCYNEEKVLPETNQALVKVIQDLQDKGKVSADSRIYYVNDGSSDQTQNIIQALARDYSCVEGISLSRNVGHQNALLAGLLNAEGDVLVSIDADLQDDVLVIENMVDAHLNDAADIVYGVRSKRTTDTFFKRFTAQAFYKFMISMGVDLVHDHADFRLMSRRSVEALREFKEANLFLRGIIPLIGFSTASVFYERKERFAGESKYPLRKMIAFAFEGISSFSIAPLRVITFIGFLVFFFSAAMGLFALYVVLFTDRAVPGWASTVIPIYFIGGVQILCIGILGEYIGKIYKEVKRRPRYLIDKTVSATKDVE